MVSGHAGTLAGCCIENTQFRSQGSQLSKSLKSSEQFSSVEGLQGFSTFGTLPRTGQCRSFGNTTGLQMSVSIIPPHTANIQLNQCPTKRVIHTI
jgi:hypothetical protein